MFKQSMMTLSALTVLVALSGVCKAEGDTTAVEDGYKQLTCAEAMQAAWFLRELQRTDGGTVTEVPVPPECNRDVIAVASNAAEETK